MTKLTTEDKQRRARKQERRTANPEYKRVERVAGATWSLPQIVKDAEDSRLERIKQKLGLDRPAAKEID